MSVTRVPGKYGRRPHDPSRPAIALADVLTGVVPSHPAAADYLARLPGWQLLGNGVAGDCNAVAWSNTRRLVTATLSTEHYPTQEQVWAFYRTQNPGFDPSGSASTNGPGSPDDAGMNVQAGLEYLHANGGPDGVKAVAFARVDHTKPAEVKAAIAIFGSVWTGIEVQSAQELQFANSLPWDYVSGSPVEGGHAILTGGYGPPGHKALGGDERFITWSEETSFTDAFWSRMVQECWVVVWPEHLLSRAFLAGVDLNALAAAYQDITGSPLPPFSPPPPADPDAALKAAATPWVARKHVGANEAMAVALRAWLAAKG